MLFAKLVKTGKESSVFLGWVAAAVVMILAGLVELFFGVDAERKSLEDVARPLSEEEAAMTRAQA